MLFSELVALSAEVAANRARRKKTEILAKALAAAAADERPLLARYLSGQIRQVRLGVGTAQLAAALEQSPAADASLTVLEVDAVFEAVAATRGAGSAARRQTLVEELFRRCTASEQRFVAGLLTGNLRQGALESVLVDAIALATGRAPAVVRRAQMLAADLATVVAAAFDSNAAELARFDLQLFRPVQPMLAATAQDVDDALAQLGMAAFEWKLDGVRVQVHRRDEQVAVYSRTQKDITAAVPEVVDVVRSMPARELVLDGEVLALHPDGKPVRFQETMRRLGRQRDVETVRPTLPLSTFFFDCLYRDGESLLDAPATERVAALASVCPTANLVPRLLTDQASAAEAFYRDTLARGHEGVMAKDPHSTYAAGRRGASWLKVKQANTLDLVVIAAEWGSGRRKGWLSNLHLGARDPDRGGVVMLGKTFKGLTDEMLETQTRALLARETHREGSTVHVRPELVVEVAFNEVQTSSHYPGGVTLRFARVKRYRGDKRAEEADTIAQVRALHAREEDGAEAAD